MKKTTLSLVASAIVASSVSAATITLYQDPATGQVFTTPAEGRVEMGDFIDAKKAHVESLKMKDEITSSLKSVKVKSKAKSIDFSGTHYLGYTMARPDITSGTVDDSSGFEMRRNYVQVKGYLNDKDYLRVTLDSTKELASDPGSDGKTKGYAEVFVKYAYLWLDNVLPYTGVEAGIAHRPWIDYEEHNAWLYRSINKVALEHKNTATEHGPDLVNSADFGVNFKTKTQYFSSEIGLFNGEGYHADKKAANQKNSGEMSVEYRLTGHILGSGKNVGKYKRTEDTYAHISTYGLMSDNHKDDNISVGDSAEYDRKFYGIHAVYNNPMFLLAGQIFTAEDETKKGTKTEIDGWSINSEFRPIKDWTVIARYDVHEKEKNNILIEDATQLMYGVAYKYSDNVTFILSNKNVEDDIVKNAEKTVTMLTTEIKW
ncbi:MAG: hypothetical protein HXX81_05730 [Campylobacterales bacterium]|nr:hypothetical protein [Campylobacterales bacterium]